MTKTERLSVKLLPRDKELLDRMAKAEGESLAVVVRRMIRKAADDAGLSYTHAEPQRNPSTHQADTLAQAAR